MAKYERRFKGAFDEVLSRLHDGILEGSVSASYEDGSDWMSAARFGSMRGIATLAVIG